LDIATYFPEIDALRIKARPSIRIVHQPTNRLCFFFVRASDGPLADLRVRQAVKHAIDRRQIVDAVLAGIGGEVCATVFPQTLPWSNRQLMPDPHDPDRATALLTQAGATDADGDGILEVAGRPLVLNMWTYETRAALKPTLELVQAQLLKVGIGSRLKVTRNGAPINQAMQSGEVHLNLQMWNTAPQGDPDFFVSSIFTSDAASNFMGYHNEELDRLARQGKATFDPVKRKRIYDRIQEIIYDECPVIVLFHKSMVSAVRDHVAGYRIHPAERYMVTPRLGRD
jgi:peptide/nickel transport system substrate-binding protein